MAKKKQQKKKPHELGKGRQLKPSEFKLGTSRIDHKRVEDEVDCPDCKHKIEDCLCWYDEEKD